ncbi:MAG: hypothetical protein HDT11_01310 [Helicobacter sp.]|nr:hypothetical protein [Helicobacter sp.]
MFYKDLGYEYIQQGLDRNANGEKIMHHFYDVPIYNIDIIKNNYFTTILNKQIDDEIYAVSFDYSGEILLKMLESIPKTQQKQILSDIERVKVGNRKVDLVFPIVIHCIQAHIGEIYRNINEIYAPFIIKEINAKSEKE